MLNILSDMIWKNAAFHQEMEMLLNSHLRKTILRQEAVDIDKDVIIRLLRSAAILACSKNVEYRDIAYKIVVAASNLYSSYNPIISEIMVLVLNRLGNFPASAFAIQRYNVDSHNFPIKLAIETEVHKENNSILIGDNQINFTDFQFSLWSNLLKQDNISVSAPTSAGKSFVVQAFLRHSFQNNLINQAAYIVPSRALVNQVSNDVNAWLGQLGDSKLELYTVPFTNDTPISERSLYVMTQERFQLVQSSHPGLTLDVLVADEIQGIGEGPRGVLLSSVIEEALNRNSTLKVLFAGPNLANPAEIGKIFDIEMNPIKTKEPTVSQNLFLVSTSDAGVVPALAPNQVSISSVKLGGRDKNLGIVELQHPITRDLDKYIYISTILSNDEQSLIYVNGPAMAEKVAFGMSDVHPVILSRDLDELSNLAAEMVHPKFQLVETVKSGIAFHYGRLPTLLRQNIEKYFSNGCLRYLICTSTLLQGVNLPAKNLFLYKPERGEQKPITSIDFWNLAGRAGRLRKEFEGNVFLIDYPLWNNPLLQEKDEETVVSSLQYHINNESTELLDYIKNPNLTSARHGPDKFENTFVKLYSDYQSGSLMKTLNRMGLSDDNEYSKSLNAAFKIIDSTTSINPETITSSPTVSIYRQQALYERLKKSIKKHNVDYVLPKHPESPNAYSSLLAIIKRCHDEIFNYPKTDKSHQYFTLLALKWIRGESIPKIIDAISAYHKTKGNNPNLPTIIRNVLKEIEHDLRFKYVRAFSCYTNILKQILQEMGQDNLIKSIPSIALYMEIGAVNQTMISLIGIGVSRFTANKLQAIMGRTDFNQTAVRDWLLKKDSQSLNIPVASIEELLSKGLIIN